MRGPVFAIVVSVLLLFATWTPVARDPRDDGFPLSTYPMFAYDRPTQLTMSYAIGVTRQNERRYLTPSLLGSAEVLQARAIVENAVAGGPRRALQLCREIANRISDDDIATIRIVTGTHDAIAFLVDDRLGPETERARCPVPR